MRDAPAARPQANCNVDWKNLAPPPGPAFSENVGVCPQREEVQLTMWLMRDVTAPAELAVAVPPLEP